MSSQSNDQCPRKTRWEIRQTEEDQSDSQREVAKMEADMGAMWPQAEEAKEWAGHQNQEEARTGCPLNPLDGVGPSGPQNHEVVNVCYF